MVLDPHERASAERRIEELNAKLNKRPEEWLARPELFDQWMKILGELTDLRKKLEDGNAATKP